jgi:type II secretory pathway pseudopilin PulG
MHLEGQAGQRGYAMAALLVTVAVMAIIMTALLPVWRQQAQREKEAELAFRGEQYARAIYLFRVRNNNQSPPSVDVLVQGKYLRKKYKDPVTGEDFQPIFGGQQGQQQPGPQGRGGVPQGRGGAPGGVTSPQGRGGGPTPTGVGTGSSGAQGVGQSAAGLFTVQSKSKEASIRIYRNASHYNEWQFFYNARGRGGPAGEGAQPGMPGVGPGRGSSTPGRGTSGPFGPGADGSRTVPGRPLGGRGPGRGGS